MFTTIAMIPFFLLGLVIIIVVIGVLIISGSMTLLLLWNKVKNSKMFWIGLVICLVSLVVYLFEEPKVTCEDCLGKDCPMECYQW